MPAYAATQNPGSLRQPPCWWCWIEVTALLQQVQCYPAIKHSNAGTQCSCLHRQHTLNEALAFLAAWRLGRIGASCCCCCCCCACITAKQHIQNGVPRMKPPARGLWTHSGLNNSQASTTAQEALCLRSLACGSDCHGRTSARLTLALAAAAACACACACRCCCCCCCNICICAALLCIWNSGWLLYCGRIPCMVPANTR